MTWFETLFGFPETSPEHVRAHLALDGEHLVSQINQRRVRYGRLTLPSLAELRLRAPDDDAPLTISEVVGDVRALHADPAHAGALFQAASQFNLLEMADPSLTPEAGVGIYEHDRTQGPACAMACGGGTVYRNYFAPVGGQVGQSKDLQIDASADLAAAFGAPAPWSMQNGYAMASAEGLAKISARLEGASEAEREALRGRLRIGVQSDVEVLGPGHPVTQVYGSALPVAYGAPPAHAWEAAARLVLEASYEATVLAARAAGIRTVFLTLLGGGVFGNHDAWIEDAIVRAMGSARGLDVRLVSYGRSHPVAQAVVRRVRAG